MVRLLSEQKPGRLATIAIVAYAGTTVLFLYSLIVFVLLFAAAAEQNAVPTELESRGNYALLVIFAAVFAFLAAIGLSGWIRSRAAGIATTVLAAIASCLTAAAIASVLVKVTQGALRRQRNPACPSADLSGP